MKQIGAADIEMKVQRRAQIDAIHRDSPQAHIVVLEHTAHRCFIQKRERVIEEIWKFLR
jgi:hypothetical protein